MKFRIVVVFSVLALFAGVLPAKEPTVGPAVYNVLTDDDEVALGRASATRLANDMPMLDDPVIDAKLATQGARIVGVSDASAQKMLTDVGGPVAEFVQRPLNQEQELEADRLAVYNMARSGWNPQGLITFIERTKAYSGDATLIS